MGGDLREKLKAIKPLLRTKAALADSPKPGLSKLPQAAATVGKEGGAADFATLCKRGGVKPLGNETKRVAVESHRPIIRVSNREAADNKRIAREETQRAIQIERANRKQLQKYTHRVQAARKKEQKNYYQLLAAVYQSTRKSDSAPSAAAIAEAAAKQKAKKDLRQDAGDG